MRLIIFEDETFPNFYPLALSRPVFALKCGFCTLAEKIERQVPHAETAYFCRPVLAPTFSRSTSAPVNRADQLANADLLLVNGRLLCHDVALPDRGDSEVGLVGDEVAYIRITEDRLPRLANGTVAELIRSAREALPSRSIEATLIGYTWDLVRRNPAALAVDFAAVGKRGIEAKLPDQTAILGDRERDVYVAASANIHPFVCIDATGGPVYIDDDVEVHPFTRIEGPAFIGKGSILLGTKLREGCTIGPTCRVDGEVEESIIHARSNKYHDGFLGHAYVGEWVNLGALTTNSDLENDYSRVEVVLNGKKIDTGSTKVGSLIGDHVKNQHRHAAQHRFDRGADEPADGRGRDPAQVDPRVHLVHQGRAHPRLRQGQTLRNREDRHGPPRHRMDRRRRGALGRDSRAHQAGARYGSATGTEVVDEVGYAMRTTNHG